MNWGNLQPKLYLSVFFLFYHGFICLLKLFSSLSKFTGHVICLYFSPFLLFLVFCDFGRNTKEIWFNINIWEAIYLNKCQHYTFFLMHCQNPNRLSTKELYLPWSIRQDVLLLFQISKVFWYVFTCHLH